MEEEREKEIQQRESFLVNYGNDIPQMFYSVLPSIKEKPPYLTINLTVLTLLL